MGRKTRLSSKLIVQIADLVRRRTKVQEICDVIGVHYNTFYEWRKRGEQEVEGLYADLVQAMEQAETDVYEDLAGVVFSAALDGRKEYQRVTKTIKDAQGNVRTEESETEKDLPPDARLSLTLLERKYPDKWGATQRVQIDWANLAVSQGADPEALKAEFKEMFLLTGNAPIPNVLQEGEDDGTGNLNTEAAD